jgi:hypothetical protein
MSDELRAVATHELVRLCFPTIFEHWKFAEYHHVIQDKSETLLSLRETIEKWRCTPLDVLFEEISE